MLDFDQYKIYYNSLLPLDLEEILNNVDNKQITKSIKLKEFPKDNFEKVYIFTNFVDDSKKQQSTAKSGFANNIQKDRYDSLVFSTIISANCSFDHLFKYPIYIYGRKEGFDIEIPLNKVMIESITNNLTKQIKINNAVFYETIRMEKSLNSTKIKFGMAFEFDLTNHKLNFKDKGTLDERIRDLKFLVVLIKNKFQMQINKDKKSKRSWM